MTFIHLLHPEIPKIKEVNINGVRHYDTPDGTLISITSLLKNFTPQGILDWRKAVGAEKANEVMRAAGDRGSKVHKIIESCLSNKPENDLVGHYGELPSRMFSQMVPALDKIDRIRASMPRNEIIQSRLMEIQKKEPKVIQLPQEEPVLTFTRKTDESKVQ